jgi:hypothetical protein
VDDVFQRWERQNGIQRERERERERERMYLYAGEWGEIFVECNLFVVEDQSVCSTFKRDMWRIMRR